MKKFGYLIFAICAVGTSVLTACSADDGMAVTGGNNRQTDSVALRLSSGITVSAVTRAHESAWDAGDEIGVFTTIAGTETVTNSGSNKNANKRFQIATGAETWVSNSHAYKEFTAMDGDIYLPANGSGVDVYAYYPYASTVTETTPLNISIPTAQNETAQDANLRKCDVLSAKAEKCSDGVHPISIDDPETNLLFRHMLSKVLIKVKLGKGVSLGDIQNQIKSVVLTGQPTVAGFNPVQQSFTVSETAADIKSITARFLTEGDSDYEAYDASGTGVIHTFRALVLPNNSDKVTGNAASTSTDVSVNPHLITFTVGDGTIYNYPITYTLRSGYQTTFMITFGASGIKVDAAIQPWSTDSTTGLISPKEDEEDD